MWMPIQFLQKLNGKQNFLDDNKNKVVVYVKKDTQNKTHLDCRGMKLESFEKGNLNFSMQVSR